MDYITLVYSFWVKIRQIFLNFFIGSNSVIVCSESSFVPSDVYFFVRLYNNFPVVRRRSIPVHVSGDLYC